MHETIEGEVIVIDLDTGTYYSLRETGADVWQGIELGAGEDQIVDELAKRYDASPEDIRSAVGELLAVLKQEGLVAEVDESADAAISLVPASEDGRRPFRAPVLEKHTDMQDLILLDPVHEVDARGWPHPA